MSQPERRTSKGKKKSIDKGVGDEYEGETSKGKREGKGTCRFAHGDVYEGEWKEGKMHGRGWYRMADGDVFEGIWKAGLKQGPGTMWYASGRADVVCFVNDADESVGARWSVDRQMAWRLERGDVVEEITPEAAAKIADELGEPVPAESTSLSAFATSPLLRATGATMLPSPETA